MQALLLLAPLSSVVGLWSGHLDAPDLPEPLPIELWIEAVSPDGALRASMAVAYDHSPVVGSYDEARGTLAFEVDFDDDDTLLTVCERGYAKRSAFADYRAQGRGGLGLRNISPEGLRRNGDVVRQCKRHLWRLRHRCQ